MHLLNSLRDPLSLLLALQGATGVGPPPILPKPPMSAMSLIPDKAPPPSAATVAALAASCVSCHGPDGKSSTAIPSIAGQPESRLLARLQAFKADAAPEATIMTRLIKGYDEAQIQAMARWFAQVK
ncbi:Cytochrome subunit of sulfide dehydrogenase [compost metagenome]